MTGEGRRPVPANIEAEQALLGALLMERGAFPLVAGTLTQRDFFEPVHRHIYKTIEELVGSGRTVSPITIADYLPADRVDFGADEDGNKRDARWYVAHLAANSAALAMVPDLAKSVADNATRRRAIEIAEDLADSAFDLDAATSPGDIIGEAIEKLSVAASARQPDHTRPGSAGAAADEVLADLDAKENPPVSTGLLELDKIIGGTRRGTLLILGGRPGMLKSTLASVIAINQAGAAVRTGARPTGVIIFSLEMSRQAMAARMLTDLAWRSTEPVLYQDILDRKVTREDHRALLAGAAARLREMPIIIDPKPGLTAAELRVRAMRHADVLARRGHPVSTVIVDHLMKMRTRDLGGNRSLELGDVTNDLAAMAKDLDACSLVLSQLSRGVESRDDKRPGLSDLRESGRIEEDADVVIFNYREAYYLRDGNDPDADPEERLRQRQNLLAKDQELEAIVAKNRHGAVGTARLWVHPGAGAIRDRDIYGASSEAGEWVA